MNCIYTPLCILYYAINSPLLLFLPRQDMHFRDENIEIRASQPRFHKLLISCEICLCRIIQNSRLIELIGFFKPLWSLLYYNWLKKKKNRLWGGMHLKDVNYLKIRCIKVNHLCPCKVTLDKIFSLDLFLPMWNTTGSTWVSTLLCFLCGLIVIYTTAQLMRAETKARRWAAANKR